MKAKVSWVKDMTFTCQSESGHELIMDGSKESAATPMEMVLMSAGTCSAIDVVSILEKARQNVTNVDVELSAERADSIPKVFTAVHLHFIVTGDNVAEKHVERAVQLSADKYCSVAKMLESTAKITHSFEIQQG